MDKSNKKKNIAVFVKNLTSGGAEKQAVLLAKALQYDYDMHFVIFNGDKMHRKYLDMLENAERIKIKTFHGVCKVSERTSHYDGLLILDCR